MAALLSINDSVRYIHLLQFFLIHIFFPDKNSAQTDEEKQRERQRNERELKHAELEAQHFKVNKIYIW